MPDSSLPPGADHNAFELIDAMTDTEVIRLGVDGTIQSWNRGAHGLKGYTAEETIGRPVTLFYTEEDRASNQATRELDAALRTGRYETEGWRVRKDGSRFWASVVIQPLMAADGSHNGFVKITRDLSARRDAEQRLQRQRDEILELSTPVIQVWEKVLVLPLIGTLDSNRAARLTEGLLNRIAETQAEAVIIDVSGVPTIDTQVAQHLIKTVQAAGLMGTSSILCGVRAETAQAMVHLGIELGQLRSRNTLRDALQLAIRLVSADDPVRER